MEPDLGQPCTEQQNTRLLLELFCVLQSCFLAVRASLMVGVEEDRRLVTKNFRTDWNTACNIFWDGLRTRGIESQAEPHTQRT